MPSLNAVNVYNGLFYNAWDISQSINAATAGAVPHSLKNAIATATITSPTLRGTPSFTVEYAGSKVVAFDLISFWFGCNLPLAQSTANTATQCSILVSGFDAYNKEKVVATFTFTPIATQLASTPMIQAILPPGFSALHNVTVVQADPARQVLKVDNVKYKTYST